MKIMVCKKLLPNYIENVTPNMILKYFSFKMKLCAVVQGNAHALRGEHEKIIEQ